MSFPEIIAAESDIEVRLEIPTIKKWKVHGSSAGHPPLGAVTNRSAERIDVTFSLLEPLQHASGPMAWPLVAGRCASPADTVTS